jgi:hypothetical protein
VTVFLFLSAFVLLWAAWLPMSELVFFISINYPLFAVVFLMITLSINWRNCLFHLPQWILLLPVSLLCLI